MTAYSLADRIDALLPQTQCTRCGFPTCRAYAQAIAENDADIDRCPPGGADGVAALAQLLDRAPIALNPLYGIERAPLVAVIDEDLCIGCTKCIQACPVDAIVGAGKRMHTVIAAECTGCELCLPPCPVDCIALVATAAAPLARTQVLARATHARERYRARETRRARTQPARAAAGAAPAEPGPETAMPAPTRDMPPTDTTPRPIARDAVLAAIARGKARRLAKGPST